MADGVTIEVYCTGKILAPNKNQLITNITINGMRCYYAVTHVLRWVLMYIITNVRWRDLKALAKYEITFLFTL